jgi:hypothetical protein
MQRVVLGILTVIVLGTVVEFLVPTNSSLGHFFGTTGLGLFLPVAFGAFIAQRSFLIPALVITSITWTYTVYLAFKIASVVEATSILQVASNNVGGLAVYLVAAALGALSGMWLSSRLRSSPVPIDSPFADSE